MRDNSLWNNVSKTSSYNVKHHSWVLVCKRQWLTVSWVLWWWAIWCHCWDRNCDTKLGRTSATLIKASVLLECRYELVWHWSKLRMCLNRPSARLITVTVIQWVDLVLCLLKDRNLNGSVTSVCCFWYCSLLELPFELHREYDRIVINSPAL